MSRSAKIALLLVGAALCFALAPYASADGPSDDAGTSRSTTGVSPIPEADGLASYRGLGAWVDMYDAGPWRYPRATVRKMADRGVKTLFLETANYRKPLGKPIYRVNRAAAMLDEAHTLGIEVVAWYVPSFDNLRLDFRRSTAAIDFETEAGSRFDSFALDIEATVVRDIATRNRRANVLATRLRDHVGPGYTMGAIVPEAGALYWPSFPYREMAARFDVFLPMAYFTYRTSGYDGVYRFVSDNVAAVRRETGDRTMPVHLIGGIAEDASASEVEAMVKAAQDRRSIGTSLYDFPTTTPAQWRKLAAVR